MYTETGKVEEVVYNNNFHLGDYGVAINSTLFATAG